MKKRKAIIISILGKTLNNKEKKLIKNNKPWGIILFSRNIESFSQLTKLIESIRKVMKDNKYPILIDEEGGSVRRLSKFINNKIYSQKLFGDMFKVNNSSAITLYKIYINNICKVFKSLGININTSPVLDILKKKTNSVIGSRSYSMDRNIVSKLGKTAVKIYNKNKVATVIKHLPGHGSALSDSHKKLPIVNDSFTQLKKNDFFCFKGMSSLFGMTAHILYSAIDPKNVSTHSKIVIKKIIRNEIGFKGILISDDISMKALRYDLITNANNSLQAGCNLVMYCAGKYNESLKLLNNMPFIDKFTIKKTSEFYKFLS